MRRELSKKKMILCCKLFLVLILIGNPWSRLFGESPWIRLLLETKTKVTSFQQTIEVNENPL